MSEWKEMALSNATCINPSVSLVKGKKYPFVDMASIDPSSRCVFAKEVKPFNAGGSRFETGDTLMARITPCLENGKIARFCGVANSKAHGSTEFIVIRGRERVTLTDYVYYLVKWEKVRSYAISQMSGTSGRQRVTASAFDHIYIPVPPLPEQKAIARILGSLDDKIELNRRMNETLEAMARAIFKDWFVDFGPTRAKMEGRAPYLPEPIWSLFPDAIDPLSGLPVGWEETTISKYLDVKRGGSPRPIQDYIVPKGIPWVKIADATSISSPFIFSTKEFIKPEGLKKTVKLNAGSLILSNSATPGLPKFLMLDACIHDGWLYFPKIGKFTQEYLYLLFLSVRESLVDQGNGSIFTNLKTEIIKNHKIVDPPRQIIELFQSHICNLFEKLLVMDNESRILAELRDRLLPKLMSGEIRVKDAERLV